MTRIEKLLLTHLNNTYDNIWVFLKDESLERKIVSTEKRMTSVNKLIDYFVDKVPPQFINEAKCIRKLFLSCSLASEEDAPQLTIKGFGDFIDELEMVQDNFKKLVESGTLDTVYKG